MVRAELAFSLLRGEGVHVSLTRAHRPIDPLPFCRDLQLLYASFATLDTAFLVRWRPSKALLFNKTVLPRPTARLGYENRLSRAVAFAPFFSLKLDTEKSEGVRA